MNTKEADLPDNTYKMLRKKFGEYHKDGRPNSPGIKDTDPKKITPILSAKKKKTFEEFMKEGKGDAIKAAIMLGKKVKQVSPKLMAKTKEFIRNQRFGLNTKVRLNRHNMRRMDARDAKKILKNPSKYGKDDLRIARETKSTNKKGVIPNEKIEKTDKYSKLATDRKSIHPPTADAAQAKFTDRKVELIKNKNNRRRAKERLLRRMFEKGDK